MENPNPDKVMLVESFNMMRDLIDFVNSNHIQQSDIFQIEDNKMGTYMLVYFKEQ